MIRLKLVGEGLSSQAKANSRGKLFEKLMAKVLLHQGYEIDSITPNINLSGMELDIIGRQRTFGTKMIAECKYYEDPVSSDKIQAFVGKYLSLWLKDNTLQGLFLAIPSLNSHAKGFWHDNVESHDQLTLKLLQEPQVTKSVLETFEVSGPKLVLDVGFALGDQTILYCSRGLLVAHYVLSPGETIPGSILVTDQSGVPVDSSTLDFIKEYWEEANSFKIISANELTSRLPRKAPHLADEQIAEVRGSSSFFEYQFPASPEFFVGRQSLLSEVNSLVEKVLEQRTSARGLLFEAYSGWGKSSTVLAVTEQLRSNGHLALAIDSRSAEGPQFVLRVFDYLFNSKSGDLIEKEQVTIGGFEGLLSSLREADKKLKARGKLLLIFFDQFENIFFVPDTLKHIKDLLVAISDQGWNICLGFSWKSDLIGTTTDFPYQTRDIIRTYSHHVGFEQFSESETNIILDKLSQEIHAHLRKDLRFLLSEFSQGYPWLLKKLCSHVKSQRDQKKSQVEIAYNLLNVAELFKEDLKELSAREEDTLRRIARMAPVNVRDFGDEFEYDVVQALVNKRLITRIGQSYDIYWDIFRDYLNSGRIPVQENYILHTAVGQVSRAATVLSQHGGKVSSLVLQSKLGLSEKSFYNVARDLRLLGVVRLENNEIELAEELSRDMTHFDESYFGYLRDRLRRNRTVSRILAELDTNGSLDLDAVARVMTSNNPYISASDATWHSYAQILAKWMDAADMVIYEPPVISKYESTTEVRNRNLWGRKTSSSVIPTVQYSPIEKMASILDAAVSKDGRVRLGEMKPSTAQKSLAALEQLGFIRRKTQTVEVLEVLRDFVQGSDSDRREIFARAAQELTVFNVFLKLLQDSRNTWIPISKLGSMLALELGMQWRPGTAEVNAKILLDWARNAQLAPGVFSGKNRGGVRRRSSSRQLEFLD